jgi:hypothetical protein
MVLPAVQAFRIGKGAYLFPPLFSMYPAKSPTQLRKAKT